MLMVLMMVCGMVVDEDGRLTVLVSCMVIEGVFGGSLREVVPTLGGRWLEEATWVALA